MAPWSEVHHDLESIINSCGTAQSRQIVFHLQLQLPVQCLIKFASLTYAQRQSLLVKGADNLHQMCPRPLICTYIYILFLNRSEVSHKRKPVILTEANLDTEVIRLDWSQAQVKMLPPQPVMTVPTILFFLILFNLMLCGETCTQLSSSHYKVQTYQVNSHPKIPINFFLSQVIWPWYFFHFGSLCISPPQEVVP